MNPNSPNYIEHPPEYREGQAARMTQQSEASCPYPAGSSGRARWLEGFASPYDYAWEVIRRWNEHFIAVWSKGAPKLEIDQKWPTLLSADGADTSDDAPDLTDAELDEAEHGEVWFQVLLNGLVEYDVVRFCVEDAKPVLAWLSGLPPAEIDELLSDARMRSEYASLDGSH